MFFYYIFIFVIHKFVTSINYIKLKPYRTIIIIIIIVEVVVVVIIIIIIIIIITDFHYYFFLYMKHYNK